MNNTLLKVFVVINFLLSVAFCTTSMILFANRKDWKETAQLAETKAADLQKKREEEKAALEKDIASHLDTIDSLKSKMSNVESDKEELTEKLARSESEVKNLRSRLDTADGKIDELTNSLKMSSDQLEALIKKFDEKQKLAQSAREDLINMREQVVAKEKERSSLKTEVESLERRISDLETNLREKEWVLKTLRENNVEIPELIASEAEPDVPIHGKVLSVMPNVNLVLVSVGERDRVKEGYRFTVYRGDKYIGKVQIESVYADKAAGRILTNLMAANEAITEGDSASTRVY